MWSNEALEKELPTFVRYFSKAVAVGKQRSFEAGYLQSGEFLWGAGLCLRAHEARQLYLDGFNPILSGRLGKRVMSGEDGELVQLLQIGGLRGYYCERMGLFHRVDSGRFNLRYFFTLFYGMGLALPAIRAYRLELRGSSDLPFERNSAERPRYTRFTCRERISLVFYYALFGTVFYIGALLATWNGVGRRAKSQVKRLQRSIRTR
eukprot:gene43334-53800_t